MVDGHWVFGGIERDTTKSFMVVVDDRRAVTLISIIQRYIRPIISDEWRAYSTLSSLGYTHQTVNHSQNFVGPNTGAHTNNVEGYRSFVKRQMRRQGVMNTTNDLFPTYLLESLWRKRFSGEDLFEKLLSCISMGGSGGGGLLGLQPPQTISNATMHHLPHACTIAPTYR